MESFSFFSLNSIGLIALLNNKLIKPGNYKEKVSYRLGEPTLHFYPESIS